MTSSSPSPVSGTLLRRVGTVLGWLSLFATLALLSTGVSVTARADEVSDQPSPACRAEDNGEQMATELSRMIERLRARAEAQGGDQGHVVVLNTRGYHYGSAPEPQPSIREGGGTR